MIDIELRAAFPRSHSPASPGRTNATPRILSGALAGFLLLASACTSAEKDTPAPIEPLPEPEVDSATAGETVPAPTEVAAPQEPEEPEEALPLPQLEEGDTDTWIQLISGEWLKGELSALTRDQIEFDSNELDDLVFDFENVTKIVTNQMYTVMLADRETTVGVPTIDGDKIMLETPSGPVELTRDEIVAFTLGEPTERNYWSGRTKVAATLREGNTDQRDLVLTIVANRRTAGSRLNLTLDSVTGDLDGVENVNNQTFRTRYDVDLSRDFFLTPLGAELFRDPFQNLQLRAAPYFGVGYRFIDNAATHWDGSAGLGYRFVKFESVEPGEEDTTDTAIGILGTAYTRDITNDIEFELAYNAQIGLEDIDDTNQDLTLRLAFDFVWDLSFDFGFVLRHVGMPIADENGETPESTDLRFDFGLSWEF